jgi:hypothetical protein
MPCAEDSTESQNRHESHDPIGFTAPFPYFLRVEYGPARLERNAQLRRWNVIVAFSSSRAQDWVAFTRRSSRFVRRLPHWSTEMARRFVPP